MPNGSAVTYVYDGSFEGMLCCVFRSFERKEIPSGVRLDAHTLLPTVNVETDESKSNRVLAGIGKKLGGGAVYNVRMMFLSALEDKELAVIRYVHTGFAYGRKFYRLLDEDSVLTVNRAVQYLKNEQHKMREFLRFSDYNGYLAAVIEPVNLVLPLISSHFVNRYPNENFLIYDKAHGMALIYTGRRAAIIPVEELTLPEVDEEEQKFRRLWKLFYDTIEIKPRHNERCRMNFMPKRYWRNMTEFAGTAFEGEVFAASGPVTVRALSTPRGAAGSAVALPDSPAEPGAIALPPKHDGGKEG